MIGLDLSPLKEFADKIESNLDDVERETLDEVALNAEMYAKEYAPERTGEMMKAIHSRVANGRIELVCDVPYAVFNEYGTYFMPVGLVSNPLPIISGNGKHAFRPFLRPAMHRAMREAPEIFGKKWYEIILHG